MLGGALESLRTQNEGEKSEDAFNISLAKIQFVQVYLDDSEIPIPPEPPSPEQRPLPAKDNPQVDEVSESNKSAISSTKPPESDTKQDEKTTEDHNSPAVKPDVKLTKHLSPRPSLAQSSFSWMLGESRHRSSFVSSVSVAPEEERRGSETKHNGRPKHLFKDGKAEEDRKSSENEEDVFNMNSLRVDSNS